MYLMSTQCLWEEERAPCVCVGVWSSVTSNLWLLEQAGVELCTCSQWAFEQMCLHKVESVVETLNPWLVYFFQSHFMES